MKEKIPQHVILDLLPMYLADEVSEETKNLIEDRSSVILIVFLPCFPCVPW